MRQAQVRLLDACAACGFDPESEGMEARIRSAYSSIVRFDDAARQREYEHVLDEVGERVARGESVECEPDELGRLRDFFTEGVGWRATDTVAMVAFVGGWLGTPIVLLVIAICLLNTC